MSTQDIERLVQDTLSARAGGLVMGPDTVERAWHRLQIEREARRRRARRWTVAVGVVAATAAAAVAAYLLTPAPDATDPVNTPSPTSTPSASFGAGTITLEPGAPSGSLAVGSSWNVGLEGVRFSFTVPPLPPGIAEGSWEGSAGRDRRVAFVGVSNFAEPNYPTVGVWVPVALLDPTKPWDLQGPATLPAPTTVEGWVQWFADVPNLETTAPEPVTVAGAPGQVLDVVSVTPPAGQADCAPPPYDACVALGADERFASGFSAIERSRIHMLDVHGVTVLLLYTSRADTFETNLPAIDQLLESFTWEQPDPTS